MPIEKPVGVQLLPDTRLKIPTKVQRHKDQNWVPIFCANCGKDGGWVPDNSTFAFYICTPCAAKCGNIDGTYMVPDEVFFDKLRNVQIEEFGRELSVYEMTEAIKNENNVLSKLVSEKK
jgi:hypothetical protein